VKETMMKRLLPAFALPMESSSKRTLLLFLLVSSFVKVSVAVSTSHSVVWGVPSATSNGIFSTTTGFGLISKDNVSALCVRGGESSEEDNLLEEDEIDPDEDEDEDEIVEIEGGDDEDVNVELVEEINEVTALTAQFDGEDEDDMDTQDLQDVAAQGFEEEADTVSVEPEKTWETPESSFTTEAVNRDDGDSSAFVDRMELADAYDEDETTPDSFEVETTPDTFEIEKESSYVDSPAAPVVTPGGSSEQRESVGPRTEIDAATREILMNELKYRRSEVERMKPDVAKIAADKKLRRPTEGVPMNWFVAGKASNRSDLQNILPKVLVPVLVGALAVTTGINFDFSPSTAVPPRPPQPSRSEGKEASTSIKDAVEGDGDDSKATGEPEPETKPDVLPVNEHVNAPDEVHPRSIKPGQVPVDEMDLTLLDKGITAVERKIKAVLGWEL
jgi:hypothetical protein